MNIKISREEQETHFYMSAMSDDVFCDTSIPKDMRKLEKKGWIKVEEQFYDDGTLMAAKFKAPRNCLSIRNYNPDKPKKVMSEEHKARLMEGRRLNAQ